MLKNSKVSNMSGSYLSENKIGTTPGIPVELGNNKVIFGYILHKGEKIDESIEEFLEFLKERLPNYKTNEWNKSILIIRERQTYFGVLYDIPKTAKTMQNKNSS